MFTARIRQLCDLILELKQSQLEVTDQPYSADNAGRMVQNQIGCAENAARDLGFRYRYRLCEGLPKLIDWREFNR